MATYITLANFTGQGIKSVKDTTKRAAAVQEVAKKLGASMPQIYWIMIAHPLLTSRTLQGALLCSLLFLGSLLGSFAQAQTPGPEQAVTHRAGDPQLKWGPCPAFLPKGCGIAVLHGDPSKDNVDVFFKVPAKSTVPLHWHTSAERVVLVTGELHVSYDGQKKVILKSGTYAYGPAKLPHKAVCVSAVPCVLFIAFESPLDAVPVEDAKK